VFIGDSFKLQMELSRVIAKPVLVFKSLSLLRGGDTTKKGRCIMAAASRSIGRTPRWLLVVIALLVVLVFGLAFNQHTAVTINNPLSGQRAGKDGSTGKQTDPPSTSGGKCQSGYQYYPDKNECIRIRQNPDFAGKAKCTPGEVRRVPNPAKPGHMIEQTCGKAPAT
jgi:hypothetical protein